MAILEKKEKKEDTQQLPRKPAVALGGNYAKGVSQPPPAAAYQPGTLDMTAIAMDARCTIHILKTRLGLMFSMSEIAVEIFKENPGSFQKEIRAGRYKRIHVKDEDVLLRLAQLQIPPESITVVGATLLPPDSLEDILQHRRKADFVKTLRIAMLKLVSNDAVHLLNQGLYEEALPVTLDAIQKARLLYYPAHKLQLVPAYLLGAQIAHRLLPVLVNVISLTERFTRHTANLGLGRDVQSEDLLGVAAWLLVEDNSSEEKSQIRAQITRLFGQLYFLEKRYDMALKAFGEYVYYISRLYGHMDVRNTLGLYYLSKVFQTQDEVEKSRRCSDTVIEMWKIALKEVLLNLSYLRMTPWGKPQFPGVLESNEYWSFKAQIESMAFKEVTDMLQDISSYRAQTSGERDVSMAEACLVLGMAFTYGNVLGMAREHLEHAADLYTASGLDCRHELNIIQGTMQLLL